MGRPRDHDGGGPLRPPVAGALPPRCTRPSPTCDTSPSAWSEEHGGFWVVTRYEDVLRVVQDWRTFSSAQSVQRAGAAAGRTPSRGDGPAAAPGVRAARQRLVHARGRVPLRGRHPPPRPRLIDAFVEDGRCEFMDAARRSPASRSSSTCCAAARGRGASTTSPPRRHPDAPRRAEAWQGMASWIGDLVARGRPRARGDVVDACWPAEIGAARSPVTRSSGSSSAADLRRPDTTAGARPVHDPVLAGAAIPELLRRRPELIRGAVEGWCASTRRSSPSPEPPPATPRSAGSGRSGRPARPRLLGVGQPRRAEFACPRLRPRPGGQPPPVVRRRAAPLRRSNLAPDRPAHRPGRS